MKSTKLIRKHLQPLMDAGAKQKNIAADLGLDNPNYLSMILSDKYETSLLSLNRLEMLSKLCGLSREATIEMALARVSDAGDRPIEMNSDAFKFILKTFAHIAAPVLVSSTSSTLSGASL